MRRKDVIGKWKSVCSAGFFCEMKLSTGTAQPPLRRHEHEAVACRDVFQLHHAKVWSECCRGKGGWKTAQPHCELSGQIANAEWKGVKNERERGE